MFNVKWGLEAKKINKNAYDQFISEFFKIGIVFDESKKNKKKQDVFILKIKIILKINSLLCFAVQICR